MNKSIKKEKISANIPVKNNHGVLIEPWITEAATAAMEMNKYVFKVNPLSSKHEIKRAVEDAYKVKVEAVNTVRISGKLRNYGKTPGQKSDFKKALVTLKDGDKIEFFEEK